MPPTIDRDRLYRLLPAVHRTRDAAAGEPLRALLELVAEQAALLEDDMAQQYDNWFVETCADWVVPYIADLVGHDPLAPGGGRWALPRREAANTLRYRRRKGTPALLGQLARDAAGWPAHVVEFGRLLAQTQSARLGAPDRGRSGDLRDALALAGLGDAFDAVARTPDLRRLGSRHAAGRYHPASVGVFVWRLLALPVTRTPAYCVEDVRPNCFTFSVLGNEAPLFVRPAGDAAGTTAGLPLPLTRRRLALPPVRGDRLTLASPEAYGVVAGTDEADSVAVWAAGWPTAASPQPVPAAQVVVADLDGWDRAPPRGLIAVDPERGRLMFPPRQLPKGNVTVSYRYGAAGEIGGGEYPRPLRQEPVATIIPVTGSEALRRALLPWQRGAVAADQPEHAVIELGDSGVYTVPLDLWLADGHSLQLRAGQRRRPVLRLLDWQTDAPDSLAVGGGPGSRLTLDGILLAGRGVIVSGALASLTVRHATLVPGWSLDHDCCPRRPSEASIEVTDSGACIVVEHSIVGSIVVDARAGADPLRLEISDSIVDATSSDGDGGRGEAITGSGGACAFAVLTARRTTVVGRVAVHAVELGENSIFTGALTVARRQPGCLRFCSVAEGSRTPRRYACQPDLAVAAAGRDPAAQQLARDRVQPRFDSLRYGTPAYGRLAATCDPAISEGADDESELGAFHALHNPQRLANLRARLAEFAPASADPGVIFAD